MVFPLVIRSTVVTGWRSPADGVVGLGGLTVQAHCLSGYSHYPPPQPPAQLSPNQRGILWLALENGNRARARALSSSLNIRSCKHATAAFFCTDQKCHTSRRLSDIILCRSFTRPSTALA